MFDLFTNEPHFLFSTIAMAIFFGSIALTILGVAGMRTWRKHQATKMESDLKAEMIAAGMSADDIERVLAAKMNGDDRCSLPLRLSFFDKRREAFLGGFGRAEVALIAAPTESCVVRCSPIVS